MILSYIARYCLISSIMNRIVKWSPIMQMKQQEILLFAVLFVLFFYQDRWFGVLKWWNATWNDQIMKLNINLKKNLKDNGCFEWNLQLFLEKSLMHVVGYLPLSLNYDAHRMDSINSCQYPRPLCKNIKLNVLIKWTLMKIKALMVLELTLKSPELMCIFQNSGITALL